MRQTSIISYMLMKTVKFQLLKKWVNTVEALASGHFVRVMKKLDGWPWPQALHPLSLVHTRFPFFAVRLLPNNEHLFQKRNYKVYNEILPYTVLNI